MKTRITIGIKILSKMINQPISDFTTNEIKDLIDLHSQFKNLFNRKSIEELEDELLKRRNDLIDEILK